MNRLVIEGLDLTPPGTVAVAAPWSHMFTTDYPREQTWSQGDNASVCCWFSLMAHYNARLPETAWDRASASHPHRPVVWLATGNHMMAERNVNSGESQPACRVKQRHPSLHNPPCIYTYDVPHRDGRACDVMGFAAW